MAAKETRHIPYPASCLPSYTDWSAFLSRHNPVQAEIPTIDRLTIRTNLSYKTWTDVFNVITYDRETEKHDFYPCGLHQQYTNDKYGCSITNVLSGHYLSSGVRIVPKEGHLNCVSVSSEATKGKDGWVAKQKVLMYLKQEYAAKLKDEGVIPITAGNQVRIESGHDRMAVATIENKAATGVKDRRFTLADEVASRICAEVGFDFELLADKITGTIGDISFTLPHVKATSLNPHNIWSSLTGIPHFIFPVKVLIPPLLM